MMAVTSVIAVGSDTLNLPDSYIGIFAQLETSSILSKGLQERRKNTTTLIWNAAAGTSDRQSHTFLGAG
jgi:hypothetical protein